MPHAFEFIGPDYAAFTEYYRVLTEAHLKCREAFGFNQISAISDPYRESQGFGAVIVSAKRHLLLTTSHFLQSVTVRLRD
jgi:hypothetical protein